ncbi:F-box/FBD/LRR-repeat protein At1g13570-like [Actinidia eriantha]|uniref:F-box/FBD/LRR-repeat protein At1g13570-like n=1 Tax=Actinidia eriantha TaxID=165200 RepID=UPI00258A11A1|nr:F-box/FBD/LRR-repeat protein At1g13570-like [Actinidia eriantha]
MCDSTSDIISHLPSNVLDKILMCLPMEETVRTSVLSRKWRYIWAKLPQLVFDDRFCRGSLRKTKNELIMTIYEVLLLHRGPILKFTLSLSQLENCSEIDRLIVFVSNNGIQDLTLHIWTGGLYILPSSLYSCLQLKRLNLRSCRFDFKPLPGFKGFSVLHCLELCRVCVTNDVLSSLISSCPLLEQLMLEEFINLNCLEIVAPNLRLLRCKGLFDSVCFKNTPRLAEVSINTVASTAGLAFSKTEMSTLASAPVIEFLELGYYYVKSMAAGGVPKRLPITLSHLRYLKLYYICFGEVDEASFVLCLIRSSPNLEKITIESFFCETSAMDRVLELLEVQDWSDVSLNQLRKVEILKVSGTKPEMEFIKLLLAKSSVLERMLIEMNTKMVTDKGLGILKELITFRRASPQADVTFRNPNEDKV